MNSFINKPLLDAQRNQAKHPKLKNRKVMRNRALFLEGLEPRLALAALPDSFSVSKNAKVDFTASQLLSNDDYSSELPSNSLPPTAVSISNSSVGRIIAHPNNSYTYIPKDGFVGSVSVTYNAILPLAGGPLSQSQGVITFHVSAPAVPEGNQAGNFAIALDATTGRWISSHLKTGVTKTIAQWSTTAGWRDGVTGDFNGDGATDIAARTDTGYWWAGIAGTNGFTAIPWGYWSNNPTGNANPISSTWSKVQVGDTNGDGRDDILGFKGSAEPVWATSISTEIAPNVSFMPWATHVQWSDPLIADFNGDGRVDLTARAVDPNAPVNVSSEVWWAGIESDVVTNTANYTVSVWGYYTHLAQPWQHVRTGDYNNDGRADILGSTSYGQWWLLQSNGTAFTTINVNTTWSTAVSWQNVGMADLDGDGRDDIIGQTYSSATGEGAGDWWRTYFNGVVNVTEYLGNWNSQYKSVQFVDIDQDGKKEIIGRNAITGEWRIDRYNPSGSINFPTGSPDAKLVTITTAGYAPKWDSGIDWKFASFGYDDGDLMNSNLVFNGSFETPTVSDDDWTLKDKTELPGWDLFNDATGLRPQTSYVSNGPKFEIHRYLTNSTGTGRSPDGNQHLELDAHTSPNAGVVRGSITIRSIPIVVTVGESYRLSFHFKARTASVAQDQLNVGYTGATGPTGIITTNFSAGFQKTAVSSNGSTGWFRYDAIVTATAPQIQLWFADNGIDDTVGTLLDMVSLSLAPKIDLDIDSDNTSQYAPPAVDAAERATEESIESNAPGKIVLRNDGDRDLDSIPDYLDGYSVPNYTQAANNASWQFVPVEISVSNATVPSTTSIVFNYSDADPSFVNSASFVRLWKKNGEIARNGSQNGDWLKAGVEYPLSSIVDAQGRATLYLEGVNVTSSSQSIVAKLIQNNFEASSDTVSYSVQQRPQIAVTAVANAIPEAQGATSFKVERVNGSTQFPLWVYLELGGPATRGVDYTIPYAPVGNTNTFPVSIAAGVSSILIPITAIQDTIFEGNEWLTMSVVPSPGYLVSPTNTQASITVTEDDVPVVSLQVMDGNGAEVGPDHLRFKINRTGLPISDSTGHMSIPLSWAGTATHGADYTVSNAGSQLSPPNSITLSGVETEIIVTPQFDLIWEGQETVQLTLGTPTWVTSGYYLPPVLSSSNTGAGYIVEDRPTVTLSVADSNASEGSNPVNPGQFLITRSGPNSAALLVNLQTAGTATVGVDYAALPSSVSIPAGQNSVSLTVNVIDDTEVELDESVQLAIVPSSAYVTDTSTQTVNIVSNDNPIISIVGVEDTEGDAAPVGSNISKNFTFTVSLSHPVGQPVTVRYKTYDAEAEQSSDYNAVDAILTIPANTTNKTFTVGIIGDKVHEANERFEVRLSEPVNASFPMGETTIYAYGRIMDDDSSKNACGACTVVQSVASAVVNLVQAIFTVNKGEAEVSTCGCSTIYRSNENPHPIVKVAMELPQYVPPVLKADIVFGSLPVKTVYYSTSGLTAGSDVTFAMQVDASTLVTGYYDYTVNISAQSTTAPYTASVMSSSTGKAFVSNRKLNDEFGNRWSHPDLGRLRTYGYGGDAVLIRGDGTAGYFKSDGAGGYTTPLGSFSDLFAVSGGYELRHSDRSLDRFNTDGLLIERRDRTGNSTTYDYTNYRLTSIVDPFGRTSTFTYDINGRLSTETDFAGRTTEYITNASGFVTSIRQPDPDGNGPLVQPVIQFGYRADGLMETITDPLGRVQTINYDAAGRVSGGTNPDNTSWALTPVESVGVVTAATSIFAAASPSYLIATPEATHTDERGAVTKYRTDAFGYTSTKRDALNQDWTYLRDGNGNLISETVPDPDGNGPLGPLTTNYQYDAKGRLTAITFPDGKSQTWQYDATWGQLTRHVDELGHETLYSIDPANGNTLAVRVVVGLNDLASSESDDLVTTYTYTTAADNLPAGLLKSETNARGSVTQYAYFTTSGINFGRLLSVTYGFGTASAATYSYEYISGNVSAIIDPLSHRTEFQYDQLNRLLSVTEADPDGNGPLTAPVTSYVYDSAGQLVEITDPRGEKTVLSYNSMGRNVSTTLPKPSPTSNHPVITRTYDATGNLATVVDPLFRETAYTYDLLARLTKVEEPHITLSPTQTYRPTTLLDYGATGDLLIVTNANGNPTQYEYDVRGRQVKMIEPHGSNAGQAGPVTQWTYDDAGNLLAIIDPLNRQTNYEYDSANRLKKVILPAPNAAAPTIRPVTSYEYDRASNVTAIIDPRSQRTEYAYDILDRLTQQTEEDPDGPANPLAKPITKWKYDAASRLIEMENARQFKTEYLYDHLDRLTTLRLPDPDGNGPQTAPEWQRSYDATGNIVSQTDPRGFVTSYVYDPLNRLITITQPDPDGTGPQTSPVTQYTYDLASQLTKTTDPLGQSRDFVYDPLGRIVRESLTPGVYPPLNEYEYDLVGNITEVRQSNGIITQYHQYDRLNRLIKTSEKDPATFNLGPNSPTTEYSYDNAGQLVSVKDPEQRITQYAYDRLGRVTNVAQPDPDGPTLPELPSFTAYTYDLNNNLTREENALGHGTNLVYDALDRVTRSTDSRGGITQFAYDAVSNRTSLTDSVNNTTSWVYDGLDRLTIETNSLNKSRTFQYDAASNLIQKTDRLGRVTTWQYDGLNRNTREEWLAGTNVIRQVNFGYDARSQMTSAADPAGSYTFAYNALGYRTEETQQVAGLPTVQFAMGVNLVGKRVSLQANIDGVADFRNTYSYDYNNRLSDITQTGVSGSSRVVAPKTVNFTYNKADQLTGITRKEGTTTVLASTIAYDQAGRLKTLQHGTIAQYDYNLDPAHRIESITSLRDGISTFTHDATNQLTAEDHVNQTDKNYTFDLNGNRTLAGHVVGGNNQLLSDGTFNYEYDDEGNQTAKVEIATGKRTEYGWDHRNRLVTITEKSSAGVVTKSVEQTYDVFNQWVKRAVDADGAGSGGAVDTYFTHEDGQIVLEWQDADGNGAGSPQLTHRYLWGDAVDQLLADEQVSSTTAAGNVIWPLTDHLGTVRDAVDLSGSTVNHVLHRVHDAFGNLVSETNPSSPSSAAADILFGFTSRPFDDSTGLQNNLNRWYDPVTGQWKSKDPIGFDAGDSNLGRYVGNSPLVNIDPSGFQELELETNISQSDPPPSEVLSVRKGSAEHKKNQSKSKRDKHFAAKARKASELSRSQRIEYEQQLPSYKQNKVEESLKAARDKINEEIRLSRAKELTVCGSSSKLAEQKAKTEILERELKELNTLKAIRGGKVIAPESPSPQIRARLKVSGLSVLSLTVQSASLLSDIVLNLPVAGQDANARVALGPYEFEDEDGTFAIELSWWGNKKRYTSGPFEGRKFDISREETKRLKKEHDDENGCFRLKWYGWEWDPGKNGPEKPPKYYELWPGGPLSKPHFQNPDGTPGFIG